VLTVTSAADATTDRILDAAYEELLHFGLKGVTIEDVAKRVGVARITIYRRFANKDDLLAAVALREGQRLFGRVEAALGATASTEEQLVEGFSVMLHAVRNHPIVKRIVDAEPDVAASLLASHGATIISFGRDFVAARLGIARAVAEVMVRLSASFVLSPASSIPLKTNADAKRFARTYLVPMLP
jgi:AcrR family transcriptional regulator